MADRCRFSPHRVVRAWCPRAYHAVSKSGYQRREVAWSASTRRQRDAESPVRSRRTTIESLTMRNGGRSRQSLGNEPGGTAPWAARLTCKRFPSHVGSTRDRGRGPHDRRPAAGPMSTGLFCLDGSSVANGAKVGQAGV